MGHGTLALWPAQVMVQWGYCQHLAMGLVNGLTHHLLTKHV